MEVFTRIRISSGTSLGFGDPFAVVDEFRKIHWDYVICQNYRKKI